MKFLPRSLAWIAILGPPVFLFSAVQHGALTHPFSDYCKLIPLVERLQNGTLAFSDLTAPLNQNRPATWRAVLLANAWLTGWDIRSEYVYLLAALAGAFTIQVRLLRRCCADRSPLERLVLVAILSIVSFSPAAHNNHWWSMLIQFDMGHLFVVTALALVSWNRHRWGDHALAALACWAATYTVTNGLVAFVSCTIVAQLFSPAPRRPNGLTLFWAANVALVLILYVPGLPSVERGVPSLDRWAAFTLAYLGSPIAGLLWFPFRSQFDLPTGAFTMSNAAAGFVLLVVLVVRASGILRARATGAAARAFVAFSLFALGSAALTGLGRAEFGAAGVANANASRFVLFGSYGLYACLYAAGINSSGLTSTRSRRHRVVPAMGAVVLFVCAAVTYARSWKVYDEARRFDRLLAIAYASPGSESPFDDLIYPVRDEVPAFKATLRKLRLGPYRDAPETGALERLARTKVTDEFGINGLRAGADGLILFAHPHGRFSIDLFRAAAIQFRYGVMANAMTATPPTDGVEFRVVAPAASSEGVLWAKVWRPGPRASPEEQIMVALPGRDFSGTLVFETRAAGRSENDWAYWADLEVVRAQ
jgi:hypothetical protein